MIRVHIEENKFEVNKRKSKLKKQQRSKKNMREKIDVEKFKTIDK